MSRFREYESKTRQLLADIIAPHDISIYDIEYIKEGADYYLRIYIDKPNGISIQDCELVSRAVSDKLDELDYITDSYVLEVSSPGLGRTLKKEEHYTNSYGQAVDVKLYVSIGGSKEHRGILKEYSCGDIIITVEDKDIRFTKEQVATVKLVFE